MSRKLYRCGANGRLEASTAPIKALAQGYVRIAPHSVAFNPTDYKHLVNKLAVGSGSGCDFSGVVLETTVSDVHVGDTVAGGQTGSNTAKPDEGVYSDLIDVRADSLFKFPHKLVAASPRPIPSGAIYSFEQASSLGVAIGTVALATCWYDSKPLLRSSQKGWALVYGAQSSLGFITAQVYRWMGYNVVAVASEKHRQMLQDAGLEVVLDYHDEQWPSAAAALGPIELAYDCISTKGTTSKVYEAMSSGKLHTALPIHPKKMPSGKPVQIDTPLWYLLWNKSWFMGPWFKENVADDALLDMTGEIFAQVNAMLSENFLRALPIEVFEGSIPAAMDRFGEGMSGAKLVVNLEPNCRL